LRFSLKPFQVRSPGLRLSRLFFSAARAASYCGAIDVSLSDLVPPFLLLRGPYLGSLAIAANEGAIDVKQGKRIICVVMSELPAICQDCPGRWRQRKHIGVLLQFDSLTAFGHDFDSALLSTFHDMALPLFCVKNCGNNIERNIALPTELRFPKQPPGVEPGTDVILSAFAAQLKARQGRTRHSARFLPPGRLDSNQLNQM
jgi:hypothetical protein